MKKNPTATAHAAAITTAVIYVVCALLVIIAPDFSINVAQAWFHGLDITKISAYNVTVGSFVWGLITSTAGMWIVGYIFAHLYNTFADK